MRTDGGKVICVAFDAVDAETMVSLARSGDAPTFARLLETSAVVPSRGPEGLFVSALWSSFSTGLSPEHHQRLSWKQLIGGTYDDQVTDAVAVAGTPFWEVASQRGRRVAVFDVPHSVAPDELNGVFVAEWGCHDRQLGAHSFPASLVDELSDEIGPHPIGLADVGVQHVAPCDYIHRDGLRRSESQQRALARELRIGLERKRAAATSLQDSEANDLFLVVYGEGHCAGHQFWSLHDPSHPRHDVAVRASLGDPLVDTCRAFDEALASHIERADEDTTVYVYLSHGMRPHYDGTHLLDEILRRIDESTPSVIRRLASHGVAVLIGSPRAAGVASRMLKRDRDHEPPDLGADCEAVGDDRDWRPYFALTNNTVTGGIRLNLMGREPNGQIAPGEDADRVAEGLILALEELVNLDTGELVVDRVVRVDDVYRRSPSDSLPDLFVEWNRSSPIERVWSPRVGEIERKYAHWRTGDHHAGGLVLAMGPGIEPGRRGGPVSTADFGTTVAAAMGVELDDVDGIPWASLLPTSSRSLGGDDRPVSVPTGPRMSLTKRVARTVRTDALDVDAERRLARLDSDRPRIGALEYHLEGTRGHVGFLEGRIDLLEATVEAQRIAIDELRARADVSHGVLTHVDRVARIRALSGWLDHAAPSSDSVVSVIVPTRNRVHLLPRALQSVMAQQHEHWQAVVIDDGSTDGTAEFLRTLEDPRITVVHGPGRGAGAARNLGMEHVVGDYVAYLDDDNVLDPAWFRSVAWAFDTRDEDVLYGVRVIDDVDHVNGVESGALPQLQFEPYDRDRLLLGNLADMGALAHRHGHPEARFAEDLPTHADWELFVRLTADRPPLELPAIACYYFTDAPDRLSVGILDLELARERVLHGDMGGSATAG